MCDRAFAVRGRFPVSNRFFNHPSRPPPSVSFRCVTAVTASGAARGYFALTVGRNCVMRILVAVACLLPFALAAEAGINRHSPDSAVNAAYAADETAIQGRGVGVMGDNVLRSRFFSRSLLRSIAADEVIADARSAPPAIVGDPFTDEAPHMVALRVAPVSENRDTAKVLAEFA